MRLSLCPSCERVERYMPLKRKKTSQHGSEHIQAASDRIELKISNDEDLPCCIMYGSCKDIKLGWASVYDMFFK